MKYLCQWLNGVHCVQYGEYYVFVVNYRGKPQEKCPLCNASYVPDLKGTVCKICKVRAWGERERERERDNYVVVCDDIESIPIVHVACRFKGTYWLLILLAVRYYVNFSTDAFIFPLGCWDREGLYWSANQSSAVPLVQMLPLVKMPFKLTL